MTTVSACTSTVALNDTLNLSSNTLNLSPDMPNSDIKVPDFDPANIDKTEEKLIEKWFSDAISTYTPEVWLFNQITPKLLYIFQTRGWVDKNGYPTGSVIFRLSCSHLDNKFKENQMINNFIRQLHLSGTTYFTSRKKQIVNEIFKYEVAVNSAIPFIRPPDTISIEKIEEKMAIITAWLTEKTTKFPIATTVSQNMDNFMMLLKTHLFTQDSYVQFLNEYLPGIDIYPANVIAFLRTFGMPDSLILECITAKILDKNKDVYFDLISEVCWVANYFKIYKKTPKGQCCSTCPNGYTEYQTGGIFDFAAMLSGIDTSNDLDKYYEQILNVFSGPTDLSRVVLIMLDGDLDDIAIYTYMSNHHPEISVVFTMPSVDVKNKASAFFDMYSCKKWSFKCIVDPDSSDAERLHNIYLNAICDNTV